MSLTTPVKDEAIAIRGLRLAEPEACEEVSHGASSAGDQALYGAFLAARARARGPMVCVNSRVIAWNSAAVRLVDRDDREALWAWAGDAIDTADRSVHGLRLRGLDLRGQCEGVSAAGELVGAVIRIGTSAGRDGIEEPAPLPGRRSFGWESLRESELGIAELVAEGLTNREIGARLFLSRHTVDSHLRHIFRKLGISSRVDLTRLVVEHAAAGDSSVA